ncbi:MAG: hypothetical protein HFG34_02335 [Eubacterium sp.]|nr:hypothetical protein [Eubacterium sp.]
MKNSNIVNFQEYRINRDYYNIGLIIGALRAELENGTVDMESVYSLLTENSKSAISSDIVCAEGVAR